MQQMVSQKLTLETAYEAAQTYIRSIPAYPGHFEGRGIVIPGGGARYFTNAYVAIRTLRKLGCRLPIQVWHLGPDEMDATMRGLLQELGAEAVDAYDLRTQFPARILNGWELKPYAILHCPFREVLLLDADNVVVTDPEFLFDTPAYKEHHAVFWPDFTNMGEHRDIWSILQVPYRDEPEFETGQVLVDKAHCWAEMNLTMWINEYSDFFYHYIHGDKDTFRFAWHMLGTPFAMPERRIHALPGTMCQHDFEGNRVFQHRNMLKWAYFGENPHVEDFIHEDDCLGFLQELRLRWKGMVGLGTRRHTVEEERTLAHLRYILINTLWEYERVGYDRRPMSFRPEGTVGTGSASIETFWAVDISDGGQPRLHLFSKQKQTVLFERFEDGIWEGRWLHFEKMPIRLHPLRQSQADLRGRMSLETFAHQVIADAEPMSQNVDTGGNLGFGWLYYGLVQNLRPDYAIAIGSAKGFMPFCLARAFHDLGQGQVVFIDPSYTGNGPGGWGGMGFWNYDEDVDRWVARFGLTGWFMHLRQTSDEAFPGVREIVAGKKTGLVVIDGDHGFEQCLRDFDQYSSLIQDGLVLFHDSINPHCEVDRVMTVLKSRGHQVVTLHQEAGLSLVEISRPPLVADKWGYMTQPSNRGALLADILRPYTLPGDTVFEAYCGLSPLPAVMPDNQFFGFDVDPEIIARLRETHPQHQWEQIEERQLPFADLPARADLLVALGLNYGYVSWDAQLVVPNLRFLLRYYRPRACLFEAAADYYNGEILDALAEILQGLGYETAFQVIETDMASFHRRRVLRACQPG